MIDHLKHRTILSAITLFFIYLIVNVTSLCAATSTEIDTFLRNKSQPEQLRILEDTIEFSNNNKRVTECAVRYNELVKSEKNSTLPLNALYNLGKAYWINVDYDNSIRYFYQALEVARNTRDTLKQINSAIYLGLIYTRLNDWEMVQRYYENAYKLSHLYNHYFYTASSCWNMALLSNNMKKFDDALRYEQEALLNLKRATFPSEYMRHFGYGLVYYYMSYTYLNLQHSDSSLYYCRLALVENTTINNKDMIASAHNTLAFILISEKRYDEALISARTTWNLGNELHNLEKISWGTYSLGDCFAGMKMYDSAFTYMKLYVQYKDSLNTIDSRVLSSKLELQNRDKVYGKEKEISEQKYNYAVIISVVVVVSLILISILLYSRYRLKSKLHQQVAELNATKDKFFTIISHDLKTPIASFNNLSTVVADYYSDLSEEDKIKHMKSLKHSSTHILTLLNNLLTWARLQTEKITAHPETIHLQTIADNEIASQKQSAEKKSIRIESFIPSEIYAYADADMISTVLRNILSNAVKFTPENGKIVLSATESQEFIKFEVTDTGIGIPKEVIPNLFEFDKKHSTLGTANERGTGLGLNLCKEFIILNHGTISVVSEVGKGSTFTFTIPRVDQ